MEINQILLISRHKFAKLLRSKFYWLFLIGGLGMLLLSMIPLLVAKEFRHTPEALFLISQFAQAYTAFGIFAALAIGSLVLIQDIRDGTIFPYLAKPISRSAFIFGKILGAFFLMVIFWVFQIVYFLIFLYVSTDYGLTFNLVLTFIFDLMFYFMIVSATAFFSVFLHPVWAAVIVAITQFLPGIAKLMIHTEWGFWTTLARIVYLLGPEYNVLGNWDSFIASTSLIDTSLLQKLLYYFTLLALILWPTFRIFTNRNLTPKD